MSAYEQRAVALLKTLGLVADDGVYLRWMEATVKVFEATAERRGEERVLRFLRTAWPMAVDTYRKARRARVGRVRTLLIRHGVDMSMPANREMAVDLTAFAESVAAEAHAKAIEAAARVIDYTAPGVDPVTHEEAVELDTVRACVAAIRALAPRPDHRLAARSDRATVIEAAAELEQRIRAERAGYDVSRAEEIRAAIDRLRAGRGDMVTEVHYIDDVREGGEWTPERDDDGAVSYADKYGAEEIWYWYSNGSSCGDGCAILRGADGRWGIVGLGHCSCMGPWDAAPTWHATLADLRAKEASEDAEPLLIVIGGRP